MSTGALLANSPKPASIMADYIVPYREAFVSLPDLHVHDLDVTLQADFHGGINMNNTAITNVLAPAVGTDGATKGYVDTVGSTLLTTQGDLLTHNGVAQSILSVGAADQFLTVNPAAPAGIEWTSIVTAKGDLVTSDGVSRTILPVGVTPSVLVTDSTEATGLRWLNMPAMGDLLTTSDTGVNVILPRGTDGQVLTCDSIIPGPGLHWEDRGVVTPVMTAFSGMVAGPVNQNVTYTQWGKFVNLRIPDTNFTGTGIVITTDGAMPAAMRPVLDVASVNPMLNDLGTIGYVHGTVNIAAATGIMTFSAGPDLVTGFTAVTGASRIGAYSITWCVA
jgi:hypothetical protein